MKKTYIIIILLCFFTFTQAQNDIKARIEFEEAEKAFEAEDYETAIKHLDETDKLIGKWSSKVSYLKIQSLFEITNMGNFAAPTMQPLYEEVTKYMAYINKLNPDDVPMEKLKYVYAIEKTLKVLKLYERQSPEFLAAKKEHDNKNYDVAIKLWEKLALKGNSWAMYNVAVIYQIKKDNAQSFIWHKKAVENGNAESTLNLSKLDIDGGKNKWREWLEKAAKMGHPEGISKLGRVLNANKIANIKTVMELYLEAAEKGSGSAYFSLGTLYSSGEEGIDRNKVQADKYNHKAFQKGDAGAITRNGIGYLYSRVQGDKYKALDLLNQAADKNDTYALELLAEEYSSKYSVNKDYTKAEEYLLRAVNLGQLSYNSKLGNLYTLSDNENLPKALEYYENAAEAGDRDGFFQTANLYYFGKGGIAKDYKKAAQYYEKYYESKKKNESYIDNLIEIYTRGGNGIEKDKVKAKYWENIRQTK